MLLEEVLPEYRKGRKIRRKAWEKDVVWVGFSLINDDIEANDWEVAPEPPKEIDLVRYTDGYEFVYDDYNYYIDVDFDNNYSSEYSIRYRALRCIYMNKEKAEKLVNKLNSGEWVLK